MHTNECVVCGKEFYCTKNNFWTECKSTLKCVCFECWVKSFPDKTNILINNDEKFSLKIKQDMLRCYGKETLVIEEL
jgi:hypothetical protein